MGEDNRTKYADIIDLPYNGVRHHARIPLAQRTEVIAPFSAISGLDEELDQVAYMFDIALFHELMALYAQMDQEQQQNATISI